MVDTVAPTLFRAGRLAPLRGQLPLVLPSLLACDFGRLAEEVARIEAAGARALHLDVMDGHFVPNLSFGPAIVETIRRLTDLPLDVHLMIANPERYARRYRQAGADVITVHVEAAANAEALLDAIRDSGAGAGLALNPPTPVAAVLPLLPHCDLVLVMSVMPGFGGQAFDPVALDKLRVLSPVIQSDQRLEVDGGINEQTAAAAATAGAQWLVAGTAVFGHANYQERLDLLRGLAAGTPLAKVT